MSARAVDLPSSSRPNTASKEERTAEPLPGAAGPAKRTGWRRWLEQKNEGCPKGAQLPAHVCWHILNVYLWVAGSFGVISGAVYVAHDPAGAAADPSFWVFVTLSASQLVL